MIARTFGPMLPMTKAARRNIAMCLPERSAAERSAILRAMWDNLGRIAGEFTHRRALWDPSLMSVAERYGAWGERSMYGRKFQGILRTTFVIGPDGRIRKVFERVKPKGHAAEVLKSLQ